MAKLPRVPSTRYIPRLELLEIQCTSITIIRDQSGKILGKGVGQTKEVHSEEEFAEYLQNCRREITENLKALKENG